MTKVECYRTESFVETAVAWGFGPEQQDVMRHYVGVNWAAGKVVMREPRYGLRICSLSWPDDLFIFYCPILRPNKPPKIALLAVGPKNSLGTTKEKALLKALLEHIGIALALDVVKHLIGLAAASTPDSIEMLDEAIAAINFEGVADAPDYSQSGAVFDASLDALGHVLRAALAASTGAPEDGLDFDVGTAASSRDQLHFRLSRLSAAHLFARFYRQLLGYGSNEAAREAHVQALTMRRQQFESQLEASHAELFVLSDIGSSAGGVAEATVGQSTRSLRLSMKTVAVAIGAYFAARQQADATTTAGRATARELALLSINSLVVVLNSDSNWAELPIGALLRRDNGWFLRAVDQATTIAALSTPVSACSETTCGTTGLTFSLESGWTDQFDVGADLTALEDAGWDEGDRTREGGRPVALASVRVSASDSATQGVRFTLTTGGHIGVPTSSGREAALTDGIRALVARPSSLRTGLADPTTSLRATSTPQATARALASRQGLHWSAQLRGISAATTDTDAHALVAGAARPTWQRARASRSAATALAATTRTMQAVDRATRSDSHGVPDPCMRRSLLTTTGLATRAAVLRRSPQGRIPVQHRTYRRVRSAAPLDSADYSVNRGLQ